MAKHEAGYELLATFVTPSRRPASRELSDLTQSAA